MKEKHIENDESGNDLIIGEKFDESFIDKEDKSSLKNFKIKCLNAPFILYFFILIFISSISFIIYYIYFYNTEKENFVEKTEMNWIPLKLNNRKYDNYVFNNGLEVLLIQDPNFDMDGGAIVIENGYLDDPNKEGLSTFISYLLSYLNFGGKPNNIETLENYFGKFKYGIDEVFINFRFDILHDGFKKFLGEFSSLLNYEQIKNRVDFEIIKEQIINEIKANYIENIKYIEYRENHLIEYFVYGFKNETGGEILPEGNTDKLKDVNSILVSNYIKNLINPQKIKIVLFSKYKFSISSKYMKYYFNYLTSKEKLSNDQYQNNENENINPYGEKDFNTSQIFYIRANYFESNYIKIIYYINKVGNESFSELIYKQNYFNYIDDFIAKTKNGSLYSILSQNIKSISSNYEVVLKSKIKFFITIELNSLENLNDIIYITYRYIHKIITEAIEDKIQMDRYEELKDIYRKNASINEKTFNTIELAASNGKQLVRAKYAEKYYFYYYGVPWNDSNNITNYKIIPKEVKPYFRQIKPNNSIIILGIRDKDKPKLTCNEKSKFYLNCSLFKDESNINYMNYYNVSYLKDIINSTELEENLKKEESNDFNITFQENKYKTKYIEPFDIQAEDDEDNKYNKDMDILEYDNNMTLNKFYFKNIDIFRIQRTLIKFNLYHPYLRPNNSNEDEKKCNYFLIMEMYSAIKRKINEQLSEAIQAFNYIYFQQNENNLYILVYCFSDHAYNISKIIKHIIYDINWETETDFIKNNEIYKNEVFDDYFVYYNQDILDISRFYFKSKLKNNVFNKYEFFPDDFEINNYQECIKNINTTELTSFIVHTYFYGFIEENDEKKIFVLFNYNNSNIIQNLLNKANIIETNASNFVDWMKNINKLNENHIITINGSIFNKTENGNIGFTYRILGDNAKDDNNLELDISVFNTIIGLAKKKNRKDLISNQMVYYNNFFFELMLSRNDSIIIPNDTLVVNELNALVEDTKEFDKSVDYIGNRYYYLINNFKLSIDKKQTSLFKKGSEEIEQKEYEGNIVNKEKIIKSYNDIYENKEIDEEKIVKDINKFANELKKSNKIDIFTSD